MAGMEHSSILEAPRATRGKPATGKPATPAAATARETAKPPEAAKPTGKRKLYSGSEPPEERAKGRAPPRGRGKEEEKGGSKKSKKRKLPLSTRKGSAGSGSGSDDDDDSKDEDWEASDAVEKETSKAARLLGRNDYRGPSGKKRERR